MSGHYDCDTCGRDSRNGHADWCATEARSNGRDDELRGELEEAVERIAMLERVVGCLMVMAAGGSGTTITAEAFEPHATALLRGGAARFRIFPNGDDLDVSFEPEEDD